MAARRMVDMLQSYSHATTARLLVKPARASRSRAGPASREHFPETLLWKPLLITDDNGQVPPLDIDLADSITDLAADRQRRLRRGTTRRRLRCR